MSVYAQDTSAQECRRIVNLKSEPSQQPNDSISIHGGISSNPNVAYTSKGQEKEEQDEVLRQTLFQKISDESHSRIAKIVNEINSLSDLEMISLYLSLPVGQPNDTSMLGGINQTTSVHLSNQVEQSQAYTWILSHLEEDASTCLRKDEVYEDYRSYCDNHSLKCLNTADFGKVMKRAFPNVKPRRLGQRGQSKYCYGGLRKRLEVQPPYLPDLDPLQTDEGNRNEHSGNQGTNQNVPPGESMLSECIALVLEWVEKLLGRQFVTLRQLAEYLVLNMYVNSRSCAAFALVADVHNRQSQSTSKLAQNSPRIGQEHRRKSVSSRDSESLPRLPSPRSDTARVKASGSASSDTSTPPSAPLPPTHHYSSTPPTSVPTQFHQYSSTPPAPTTHTQQFTGTPPGPPNTHMQQYANTPPSTVLQQYATPPGPPSTHLQHYSNTPPGPASTHMQLYTGTPPAHQPPAVKPNLMQLPSSIKPPQSAHSTPHPVVPMRAFPGYPSPHASYGDPYRPPPPLQYGGGTYTPQRVGKRPFEMTTQEYYSPYYPYPDSSSKRSRYELPAPVYPPQQPIMPQSVPQSPYCAPPTPSQQHFQSQQNSAADPYAGISMLSPRSQSQPPQRNSLGPRLGPSPGPAANQTRPTVGRSPSPLRFASGPPASGCRRPSPLRVSPGPVSSQESPESGGSIHLPRSPTSPFRALPRRQVTSSEPRRRTSREYDYTDGRPTSSSVPEDQKVSSTVSGFIESVRNQDLHTPTPPAGTEFLFPVDPNGQVNQSGSGLTPPTAFL